MLEEQEMHCQDRRQDTYRIRGRRSRIEKRPRYRYDKPILKNQ